MGKILNHGNWKKEKGLTLAEVVVALAIVVIISVAAVSVSISTSKSFAKLGVKRFFQREVDNIAQLYLSYSNEDFSSAVEVLTDVDPEVDENGDWTYYLNGKYEYLDDKTNYQYKIFLDFDENALTVSSYQADNTLIRDRSVTK